MVIFEWLGKALEAFAHSKEAWVYLLAGEVGVFFTIGWQIRADKRKPTWGDLVDLFLWSVLVGVLCVLIDISPLVSLTIGLAREELWKALRKRLPKVADWAAEKVTGSLPVETKAAPELIAPKESETLP